MLRKGRFVSPFSDIGFNKLFGRVNKSEVFLIDLINDVFEGEDNKAESWGLYSPQGKTWDRTREVCGSYPAICRRNKSAEMTLVTMRGRYVTYA